MKLDFIPLDKLTASAANMRCGRKAPDIADILPSVRARGILQPILLRPAREDGYYEVVAGRRRWHAALAVAAEHPDGVPEHIALLASAIIDPGDDAAALEASMIENMARLDPDEVKQWESFTALVKTGRSIDDIAATFGLPERRVRQVLALGNLLPRVRDLYRHGRIDATTVRHLTLASKARQRDWLALVDDPDQRAPTGHTLKGWLLGGQSIQTKAALFDLETYPGHVVTTLFGDDPLFGDATAFWEAQNAAIEARRAAYLDAGWADAVIVGPDTYFQTYDYEKTAKRKGGKVFIDVHHDGEVVFHEGYLTRKEARRTAAAETTTVAVKVSRPEITSTMQTYIDLHRHAAVRADLIGFPAVALRVMVAHATAGSPLWRTSPDPRTARNAEVAESTESCAAETAFDQERRAVLALLGLSPDELAVTGGQHDLSQLFLHLLALSDGEVMRIISVIMGETMMAGSAVIEAVAGAVGTDMAKWWSADDAFFSCIRDKEVLTAMVAEVAGNMVASANAGEKTKTLKGIVRAHLEGADGRTKVEHWVPRWMRFAPSAYTGRGGVGTVKAHAKVEAARAALAEAAEATEPEAEIETQRLAA